MSLKKIYDGKKYCQQLSGGDGCPIIEYDEINNFVIIYDPSKPQNGKFNMSVDEYNNIIKNASKINL